ncbi:hypothetical protein AAFF_G00057670 [Aldrovandia affinis]|uniref:Endonuclease/exonuclease/phosphatase domain-containing protein n=1 Tax=Aldrovandia affinis TaxID=143900 RepID=A0AAD7S0D7_9TELE|nr:hypothetical protein AAFF_G00057670 [Aldrovandia affinis]
MENPIIANPILPVAGVHRNHAADGGAGPPNGKQHDDETPNPEGRVKSDHSTPSNALLRCRRPFIMGTINASTVREEARLAGLAHCAEKRGVEILGVQEHRRVHAHDPIVYCKVGNCSLITSSAWRNEAQAATGGVGLLLSPRARKALRRVHQHTDRILIADFDGNPVTTIMVVYSPTNVAPVEEVEKFYEDLRTTVRDGPAHNFLAILGDFNARLGPEDAPFTYHDSTNRNGEHLAALLTEHELLAANTLFRKRMGKRWTFQDRATSMTRQLDYILLRRKWRTSILNAESYSTFDSVGSDHRVVSTRVRLSLRVPKPSPRIHHDWEAFSRSPDLQARYTVEVRNRFQLLATEEGPSTAYERFVAANVKATRECVPTTERIRVSPSTYDKIKGEELMEKVRRVEAAQGKQQYGESWRVINEMSGCKRSKEGQVAGCSPEERVTSWFTNFRDLLGTHPTVDGAEKVITAVLTNL